MPTVFGVFSDKKAAEKAVSDLKEKGIEKNKVSIVVQEGILDRVKERDRDNNAPFDDSSPRLMDDDGKLLGMEEEQSLASGVTFGGTLGGLAGLLAGAGAIAIPGLGPLLAIGPISAIVAGTAAGGLIGGLIDMGIPPDRSERYAKEVKAGNILAAVEGRTGNVRQIADILRSHGAREVYIL